MTTYSRREIGEALLAYIEANIVGPQTVGWLATRDQLRDSQLNDPSVFLSWEADNYNEPEEKGVTAALQEGQMGWQIYIRHSVLVAEYGAEMEPGGVLDIGDAMVRELKQFEPIAGCPLNLLGREQYDIDRGEEAGMFYVEIQRWSHASEVGAD